MRVVQIVQKNHGLLTHAKQWPNCLAIPSCFPKVEFKRTKSKIARKIFIIVVSKAIVPDLTQSIFLIFSQTCFNVGDSCSVVKFVIFSEQTQLTKKTRQRVWKWHFLFLNLMCFILLFVTCCHLHSKIYQDWKLILP